MRSLFVASLMCAAVPCGRAGGIGQNTTGTVSSAVSASKATPGNADEIVRMLVENNERRAGELKSYTGQREYTVTYHGLASMKASMTVEAHFDAPSEKRFRILHQSGPKLLVDRVLKRLLESETEAAKDPSRTALTPANYVFSLQGVQAIAGRQCYILHVEPKVASKFLYRGTVFVDGADYAVVRIQAEPAQNPSFWIKKTQIQHTYAKTGQFWLPEDNRSESAVRLGGTAVLTIAYGPYQVQSLLPP